MKKAFMKLLCCALLLLSLSSINVSEEPQANPCAIYEVPIEQD